MSSWHYCPDHPEVDPEDPWQPGHTAACQYHEKNRNRRPVKWGRKARARLDREAGKIGTDRGDYISG